MGVQRRVGKQCGLRVSLSDDASSALCVFRYNKHSILDYVGAYKIELDQQGAVKSVDRGLFQRVPSRAGLHDKVALFLR